MDLLKGLYKNNLFKKGLEFAEGLSIVGFAVACYYKFVLIDNKKFIITCAKCMANTISLIGCMILAPLPFGWLILRYAIGGFLGGLLGAFLESIISRNFDEKDKANLPGYKAGMLSCAVVLGASAFFYCFGRNLFDFLGLYFISEGLLFGILSWISGKLHSAILTGQFEKWYVKEKKKVD